ncbi:MAG TPA: hypothetical protein VE404_02870 [Verrucomicrobiae bacterium]|nr:hypothetical protein [Verrucomicrobiae bacterium]
MKPVIPALALLALAAGLASAAPTPAAEPAGPMKPRVLIVFESDPLVECHFLLKTWDGSEKPGSGKTGDLSSQAAAYGAATQAIRDVAVWHWFEDLVVEGPDPAEVRRRAATLPASLSTPSNRTAVDRLVEALDTAYPIFVSAYWPEHLKSLNRSMIPARRRYEDAEYRLTGALIEKMAFTPIDSKVRVLTVIRAGPVSSWGKTTKGYYTVIGVYLQSPASLVETSVHEATHLIDTAQPASGSWMLKEVRQALPKDAPPEAVDTFIHGLVTFNAGELVTRFMDRAYKPVGLRGPGASETYAPYVAAYEAAWNGWLDGTRGRDETVRKLAEGFKAARAKIPPAPAKK